MRIYLMLLQFLPVIVTTAAQWLPYSSLLSGMIAKCTGSLNLSWGYQTISRNCTFPSVNFHSIQTALIPLLHDCLGLSYFNTKSCLQHEILCGIKSVTSQTRMNQKNSHMRYVKVLTHWRITLQKQKLLVKFWTQM